TAGNRTMFAIHSTATCLSTLYSFMAIITDLSSNSFCNYTNSDGTIPVTGLILSGNTLYGGTTGGGSVCCGVVFALKTDGTGFTVLHSFGGNDLTASPVGLTLSRNAISVWAGSTVFAVNTDGTGFTNLHTFTAVPAPLYTNSDGAYPNAGV